MEPGVRRRAVFQRRHEHDTFSQGREKPRGLGAGVHDDSSCWSEDRGSGCIFEIRGARFFRILFASKFTISNFGLFIYQILINLSVCELKKVIEVRKFYFQAYIRSLLKPLYLELSENPQPNEPSWKTHMRGLMKNFLCRAGYEPCIKEARDHFKKWLTDEEPDKGNPLVFR